MDHLPIDKSKDPQSLRLFKSNFLEFFTHISPVTIIVLWVPVTAFLLITSIPYLLTPYAKIARFGKIESQ